MLNKMLTDGLVPENVRGKYDYRENGIFVGQIDKNIGSLPHDFYIVWLESAEAKQLFKNDPIAFSEVLHNTIASLDSYPDGNGRLSRLFADLALIKAGIAPAYYTSMKDYFDRGNSRAEVDRKVRINYFKEIVIKGINAMKQNLGRLFLGYPGQGRGAVFA